MIPDYFMIAIIFFVVGISHLEDIGIVDFIDNFICAVFWPITIVVYMVVNWRK